MTSPTNPQPTPPAGYEILAPEVAKMKPEGMKILPHGGEWYLWPNEQIKDLDKAINHYAETGCFFSAPLGTTALLLTPGPEARPCNCISGEHPILAPMGNHAVTCPAHPRNAYVKVLPGWLAGLKEKPERLVWSGGVSWRLMSNAAWAIRADFADDPIFAYAVPRHVFDALSRPDPIHDEVAKMEQGTELLRCPATGDEIPRPTFADIGALNERIRELESALMFYRNSWHQEQVGEDDVETVPTDALFDDCGALADSVLSRTPPPVAGSGPTAEAAEMKEVLDAALRIIANDYLPPELAIGNDCPCDHGIMDGVHCRTCDEMTVGIYVADHEKPLSTEWLE